MTQIKKKDFSNLKGSWVSEDHDMQGVQSCLESQRREDILQ